MRLDVVTIFPEYLEPLRAALLGKAIDKGLISVGVHNLRDWTHNVHKAVDDSPYGGGPGMVMKPTVWGPALDDVVGVDDGSTDPDVLLVVPTLRAGLSIRRPRSGGRPRSASSSRAVDTRESTNESSTMPRSASASRKSASATTC